MTKVFFVLNFTIITILLVNNLLDVRLFVVGQVSESETTKLDDLHFRDLYRQGRKIYFDYIQGNSANLFEETQKLGKVQRQFDEHEPFFCDVNGPGRRSPTIPKSVHHLTPGDIDIVGAIGDSLTAGHGAFATTLPQLFLEFRGYSWAIGGQGTWRQFLTLPNILKEFNPNLYGYSVGTGYSVQKLSRFNVGESGGLSRDMPHMSRILVRRIATDPKVKMDEHWKFINVHIGGNDFCIDLCFNQDPYKSLQLHEGHLTETLRIFRDSLPRAIVNVVMSPDVFSLGRNTPKPTICEFTMVSSCPCLFGNKYKGNAQVYKDILRKWRKLQEEVVDRPEFNREDFTVNLQKFTLNGDLPLNAKGQSDLTYFSIDCFHLSQKGNALATTSLWKNLLEPYNNKTLKWEHEFEGFRCPTNEHPFIRTREN